MNIQKIFNNKTLGSVLMIAGTTIGAGMLALPLKTAQAGFWPSIGLFTVCFLLMLYTVFLLLEANLMSKHPEANIISMAGERLGRPAQAVAWVVFLLLLYSVSAAYMSAGGSLITTVLQHEISPLTPMPVGMLIFAGVFGAVVYFGTQAYDHINKLLMLGLVVSFLGLTGQMTPHVDAVIGYHTRSWLSLVPAIPVVVLSFTSHVILPSLRHYLHSDVRTLKKALLYGMIIPFVFYIFWEFLILNLIQQPDLMAIASGSHPVAALTNLLESRLGLRFVAVMVGTFSFCALVTSFIAVNVSLRDFLSDGLQIPKNTAQGRWGLSLLTVMPPLVYALVFPKGFTWALGYAGASAAILYGILPSLMVYKGRYVQRIPSLYRAPGGKLALVIVMLLSVAVMAIEVF